VVSTSTVERHNLLFTQLFGCGNLHALKEKIVFKALEGVKLDLECVVHNVYGLYLCIDSCVIMRSIQ
jgi:hypothetical protein